jgi:hypothetical protein
MKYLIVLMLIPYINDFLFSQEGCKYESYFLSVNAAKYDLCCNKYESAKDKFKDAFERTEFAFGTDLREALKTARELKDTCWAEMLAIKLAKGGIPLNYFKDFENYKWFVHFISEFRVYENYHKSNFDLKLRHKLLSLRTEDSIFNESYHNWRKGEIEMTLDELIEGATKISDSFKLILTEYGFPCEQKMGYYYNNDSIDSFPYKILMIHIYQRGELLLYDQLTHLICEGRLRDYDSDLSNWRGYGDSTGIMQEMKIRYEKIKHK